MKSEMLFSRRQKLNFQKWSCFCAVFFSAFLQAQYLSLCVPASVVSIIVPLALLFSFFLIFVLNLYEKKLSITNKLDISNNKEMQLSRIVRMLSNKIGVISPSVEIVKATLPKVNLEAGIIGFPHEKTLFISADLLKVYQNGLTAASLKALIAHELSHLKQHDPLVCFMLYGAKITLYFLVIFSLSFSPIGTLALLQSVATSCVLILSQELFYAGFSRAKESLADLGAIDITRNPLSVVRFIYDNYLQYLYWGKLVLENERASQTHFTELSAEMQALLKIKHRELTSRNFRKIYHFLEKNARDEVEIAPHVQLKKYCLTWFNTHPTIKERTILCEQSVLCSSLRNRL